MSGRIDYISNGNRQENLYATYQTAGPDFWKNLARECQEEFKRFGSEGKCIEAREFIIALPENYTRFDTDGIYHPTKKIGKNNPKADGIRADNETRQDWNRTADMALVVGILEDEILEVKQEQIHDKTAASIRAHGWLPGLFRSIVQKAKSFLDGLIRQREVTPKPTLTIDMAEFTTMQNLMAQLRRRARVAKEIQEIRIPQLKAQLAEAKGLFKGKERKAIEAQITEAEKEVRSLKGEIFGLVEQAGYPDGQAFLTAYNKAESIVRQYQQDMAAWKQRAEGVPAEKPQRKSVLEELRRLEAEMKRQPRRPTERRHQMDAR